VLSVKLKNRFLTCLLSLTLAFIGVAPFGASAQTDQGGQTVSGEAALNAKADKLLKRIYAVAAQGAGVGPATRPAMAQAIDDLSRRTGVSRRADGTVGVRLLVQLGKGTGEELKAAGFSVGAVVGDIATVSTDASRLPELASLASVKKMWASTYRRPVNDRARQDAGVDNLSGQRVVSQTGRGVVVAVIDSGIDFRHPDFTVPGSNGTQTRIKFLLDMTVYNETTVTANGQRCTQVDANWNYTLPGGGCPVGRLYTSADINAALAESPKPAQSSDTVKERDKNGHGTHVAGTAAGNGLGAPSAPGTYAGMAPQADLIVVKASRENDGTDDFADDDEINAMQFVQTEAAALGEPFVANLSFGGQDGPHDGTNPDEIAIDNIVNTGAGRVFCVAAGNEGADINNGGGVHASGTVPAGGSYTLHFNANKNPSFIELYSSPRGTSGSGRYSVTVTEPGSAQPITLNFDPNGFAQQNGQFSDSSVQIWDALDDKGDSDPSNDQANIHLDFQTGAKTGTWTITLTNGSNEPASTFDAWSDGDDVSFTEYDNAQHLVGSPGTSRDAITVGAYVARSASQTIGNYAYFTSPGPTADGRQKPEISADGYYLYSSRSSDWDSTNGVPWTYGSGSNALNSGVSQNLYGGLAGTSMATPVTTGSVALVLQANPNLSASDIKTLVENNAAHDQFDPAGWNSRFGFGKLNVAAAIGAVAPAQSNPIDGSQFFVAQHYSDFLNRQPDSSGLQFWTNNIESCGTDANCRAAKRVDTSAAFFLSIEFQQTGYLVYKMYKAAFGNINPPAVPVPVRRTNWLPDTQSISSGVVVGQGDWQTQLEANKQSFALSFVQRSAFQSAHGSQDATALVNSLFANAGVTPTTQEQQAAVGAFNSAGGGAAGQAAALRSVAESNSASNALFNEAFVLMQYFGYLQRDPDAAPEPTRDFSGYNFWLTKLNQFGGNYVNAEMVKAFITSTEYRSRFGPP
jgi:subtilisin family serine protease